MKEKIVKIGEEEVKLSTSGYLVILYSDLFGSNLFEDMGRIVEAAATQKMIPYKEITTLYKLAYAMARHADDTIPPFAEWLRKFDAMAIPLISGDLIDLWADETTTQSTP